MIYLSLHIQTEILLTLHNLTFHILFGQFEIMRRATNPDFTKPENLNHLTFIFFIPENLHLYDYPKWQNNFYDYLMSVASCFNVGGLGCIFNVKNWPKFLKSKFTRNALLWIDENLVEHFWQLFHVTHQGFSFKSPNSCTIDTCCDTEVRKYGANLF